MKKLSFILGVIAICILGYFAFPIAVMVFKIMIGVFFVGLIYAGFLIASARRTKNEK